MLTPEHKPHSRLLWEVKNLRARLAWAWELRVWPWRVPLGAMFISRKRPPDWLMEHARQRAIKENWKDIVP